ncbi:helix-turn-helix domain-containing protein [Brevibacterium sp. FAM 27836]|uniref:helix-turn-helix domain-containing protein n=1 Tax=Brevibacterium sp. FAM 27836 TaxID=3446693 RepID=UPI003F5173BE
MQRQDKRKGRQRLGLTYNKLWKLLIDKEMNKGALQREADLSPTTMSKLSKGLSVNTNTLVRICETLQCDISDITEISKNPTIERKEDRSNA